MTARDNAAPAHRGETSLDRPADIKLTTSEGYDSPDEAEQGYMAILTKNAGYSPASDTSSMSGDEGSVIMIADIEGFEDGCLIMPQPDGNTAAAIQPTLREDPRPDRSTVSTLSSPTVIASSEESVKVPPAKTVNDKHAGNSVVEIPAGYEAPVQLADYEGNLMQAGYQYMCALFHEFPEIYVVAILGGQGKGKSFLLNTLWLTYFGVYGLGTDDNLSSGVSTPLVVPSNQDRHHEGRSGLKTRQTPAQSGREKGDRQTTQGIWASLRKCNGDAFLILDIQGSDCIKASADQMSTEAFFGLFAMLVSQNVLVNVNQTDLGSQAGSGSDLLFKIFDAVKGPNHRGEEKKAKAANTRPESNDDKRKRIANFWNESQRPTLRVVLRDATSARSAELEHTVNANIDRPWEQAYGGLRLSRQSLIDMSYHALPSALPSLPDDSDDKETREAEALLASKKFRIHCRRMFDEMVADIRMKPTLTPDAFWNNWLFSEAMSRNIEWDGSPVDQRARLVCHQVIIEIVSLFTLAVKDFAVTAEGFKRLFVEAMTELEERVDETTRTRKQPMAMARKVLAEQLQAVEVQELQRRNEVADAIQRGYDRAQAEGEAKLEERLKTLKLESEGSLAKAESAERVAQQLREQLEEMVADMQNREHPDEELQARFEAIAAHEAAMQRESDRARAASEAQAAALRRERAKQEAGRVVTQLGRQIGQRVLADAPGKISAQENALAALSFDAITDQYADELWDARGDCLTGTEAWDIMDPVLEVYRAKISALVFVDTHERSQGLFARLGRLLDEAVVRVPWPIQQLFRLII